MSGKIIPAALTLAASAAAAGAAVLKKKQICPMCEVKKVAARMGVHVKATAAYQNGVACTPPMGWSSWNTFRNKIDENLILETADALKTSGLWAAGYRYVNLDDCWQSSMRDANGRLQGDLTTFPSGIPSLVRRLNEKGFKAGIYSSNGTLTCEDLPASLGHERLDAETFAEWGIEYFKYDFCHHVAIPTKAPQVIALHIGGGKLSEEIVLAAENAELEGMATVLHDSKGSYVARLDNNLGAIRFSFVKVPEAGDYVLTVVFHKAGTTEKYAEVTVNGKDRYPMTFPPTKSWSREGRAQTLVHLEAGDNTLELRNPIASDRDGFAAQYIAMGKELKRATKAFAEKNGVPEKPIVYSICEWGMNKPWLWGSEAGNLWRTTPDIRPNWASIIGIYEANVRLYKYACVGGYNDPDMLEVGNGNLTVEENKAHFTLWCMMSAPLILGNDIRGFIRADGTADADNPILQILTDKDLIAIDQDEKCTPCRRIHRMGLCDVLVKPLAGGEVAVCLLNKGPTAAQMHASLKEIANLAFAQLPTAAQYVCTDLWEKTESVTPDAITASVPTHGVKVYRVHAKQDEN